MRFGFVKVAAVVPAVKVADCKFNAQQTEKQIVIADGKGIQIIVFPELNLTGYSCGDLFAQSLLLEQAELALMQIVNNTRQPGHYFHCRYAGRGQFYADELCRGFSER